MGLEEGCSCSGEKTQNWSNEGGKIARKVRLYRMFKAVISWQKRWKVRIVVQKWCIKWCIKRHKERWHKEAELTNCTVVPSSAPEVHSLRKQYDSSKASTITSASKEETTDPSSKSIEEQTSTFSTKIMASSEEDLALRNWKEVCDHNSEATQPTTPKGRNLCTLHACV